MGKTEGNRTLGRIGFSCWEDNIKMDLKGIRWEGVDLIDVS